MGATIGLILTGIALMAGGLAATRNSRNVREVPPTARMLGERASLEEWQRSNRRGGLAMLALGVVMSLTGILISTISLLN